VLGQLMIRVVADPASSPDTRVLVLTTTPRGQLAARATAAGAQSILAVRACFASPSRRQSNATV
jgi:hypothetical protein